MADYFTEMLPEIREAFLQTDPGIVPGVDAVFIGGSRLYKGRVDNTPSRSDFPQSDFNAIIVFHKKDDIHPFINDRRRRQVLANMFGIEHEDLANPVAPALSSPLWSEIDAVMYNGYDDTNTLRSIRLLSLEAINRLSTFNTLSSNDRRLYEARTSRGRLSLIVEQVTTLPNNLVIKHEQWVYQNPAAVEDHENAVFGPFADLLVSGYCAFSRGSRGHDIKQSLVNHFASVTGKYPVLQCFSKYLRYPPPYLSWLHLELAGLCPPTHSVNLYNQTPRTTSWQVFLGNVCKLKSLIVPESSSSESDSFSNQLSQEIVTQFEKGELFKMARETPTFSDNSVSYRARTKGLDKAIDIFVKETLYAEDERNGAEQASAYFTNIAIPHVAAGGELLYPFFQGVNKSELRLAYINDGRRDQNQVQRLLYAELVQAEANLRTYRHSLSLPNDTSRSRHNVQRFFHDRMIDNNRMTDNYSDGVKLGGRMVSLDKLLSLRWKINGHTYPPLHELFDTAKSIIAPESAQILSCPIAFGLGDCQGGNVMVSPQYSLKGGQSDVRFVDYEVAGLHPVMLDLAKPLYNEVMFESLYRNLLSPDSGNITYTVTSQEIIVDMMPTVDTLTQAILDIKLRYLIKPLCDEVKVLGDNLDNHVSLLSTALFLCGTLGGDFAENDAALVSNFSIGITLFGAINWETLMARFESLGLRVLDPKDM
ncbi:hypothetical protein GGR57DRAFT_500120 [Xylariaceae sp. FL1272]|nr:hypothetical protein GGR57DRAFT_500120 [Xylariaceae sp. FL1272]